MLSPFISKSTSIKKAQIVPKNLPEETQTVVEFRRLRYYTFKID